MIMAIDHTACTHPSTKAGRAKCRRDRAKAPTIDSLIASYYDGTGDLEEIVGGLDMLGVDTTAYYNDTLDAEEFIASVMISTPCTREDCTCADADRTETIFYTTYGDDKADATHHKVKVCKVAAEDHFMKCLDAIDRNIAFQQQGAERTKRDTYMKKLAALRG